jgi:hypothetical protein
MVLGNSGLQMQKNFSKNYPEFGYVPSKIFTSPVLGQKNVKNIGFKGTK